MLRELEVEEHVRPQGIQNLRVALLKGLTAKQNFEFWLDLAAVHKVLLDLKVLVIVRGAKLLNRLVDLHRETFRHYDHRFLVRLKLQRRLSVYREVPGVH
jgi:hypothetical protein